MEKRTSALAGFGKLLMCNLLYVFRRLGCEQLALLDFQPTLKASSTYHALHPAIILHRDLSCPLALQIDSPPLCSPMHSIVAIALTVDYF